MSTTFYSKTLFAFALLLPFSCSVEEKDQRTTTDPNGTELSLANSSVEPDGGTVSATPAPAASPTPMPSVCPAPTSASLDLTVAATAPLGGANNCPTQWTAAPVCGVTWQYGCYCGKEPSPARTQIPGAVDGTDSCCATHDSCYGTNPSPAKMAGCDQAIPDCANAAIAGDCMNAPDIKACVAAANAIMKMY